MTDNESARPRHIVFFFFFFFSPHHRSAPNTTPKQASKRDAQKTEQHARAEQQRAKEAVHQRHGEAHEDGQHGEEEHHVQGPEIDEASTKIPREQVVSRD
jgi:hypothetical protein